MKSVKFFCIVVMLLSSAYASAQSGKLLGDVDGDEKLTILDVNIISNMIINPTLNPQDRKIADANEDGRVSMADVVNVIDRLGHEIHNGHECVDLGTGVLWATCNIGASKPEEYGDFFAWGETKPKETYNWATYKWMAEGKAAWNYVTKYTVPDIQYSAIWYNNSNFVGDMKTSLEFEDDAARANWKGEWRMPTSNEYYSLRMSCKWTWTEQNGIKGYKVTGRNGNWIFFPAAGYREDDELFELGESGYYWSRTLDSGDTDYAHYMFFHQSYPYSYSYFRFYGHTIRAVCPK